ncbi:sensor histidine kinase [Pyxidicoccus sp. 3LG]
MADAREERVLLLTPTGRDAALATGLLRSEGISAAACPDTEELFRCMGEGAGALLVAEEALTSAAIERLVAWIKAQPPWSDIPLVLLTFAEDSRAEALFTALVPHANLTLIERPTNSAVLLAALRSALRARRRQYQVQQLLAEQAEADRRKGDFMALLGHEVRNPLSAIKAAVALLQRRAQDAAQERMSGLISRQTDIISRQIEDLLEMSRIARGKLTLHPEPMELTALTAEVVRSLQTRADIRERRLQLDLHAQPLMARVDPIRYEQILVNLLTNALKYTPPPGAIRVSLAQEGDEAVVRVRDEGIGLEPEQLHSIFEAFAQVEAARDRSQGGLGLGLPLVRNLVELHGGTVTVRSDGLGRGSEFEVRLPLERGPEAAQAEQRGEGR